MKRIVAASLLALACIACGDESTTAAAPEAVSEAAPGAPAAAAAPAQKDPLLSAVGIGVSDLAKSTDFYVKVMGMEKIRSYHLDYMDEEVLGYPEGESYIVLMHWTDGSKRNYKDNPVKVVTRV
ncbi:MAG TPA: VOC family protein, partial [Hyphomonadaceae bacterium]|nr:VOC family protein [Hyphomonadaceae bacterium]